MKKTVIIGAGLTGLSAAYHAEKKKLDYEIYEATDSVGGLCKTVEIEGFCFDYSGHLLYLRFPYFQALVKDLLGDNLEVLNRKSFIYSHGVFTRYPFQANLFGLPPKVIKECLLKFVKAYYENESMPVEHYKNFHDWVLKKLGEGIGKHFMFPYNEKVWTVSTKELTCEWLNHYVHRPNITEIFNGAFDDQDRKIGYNATFWYPKTGGIQSLCNAFAEKIGNINLKEKVYKVDIDNKIVEFESGKVVEYENLISTMSLKNLIDKLKGDIPLEVKHAGEKLNHNSVIIVNLGVKGEKLIDKHWLYLPEKKFSAYRVGVYSNFSENMSPPGTTSYYVEIAYQKSWKLDKQSIIRKVVEEMIEIGLIHSYEDILIKQVFDIECAYVIYDANHSESKKLIIEYLHNNEIMSIGRYGNWEYSGMEEAMLQGKSVIDSLYHK